jgi:thiamine-monophosphate kinase
VLGEFDLIKSYFQRTYVPGDGVVLGIGDDCALLTPRADMQLAVSSDMLVEGRHFLSTVSPEALGHKALAVNLSDLAACGAKPFAFTLALALPRVDTAWLHGFSKGMFALADAHGCALVGGDTTQGPLNICITVMGQVPSGQALLRSGAQPGDDIYVSGSVGDARLALEVFRGNVQVGTQISAEVFEQARARMERPTPRVALGQALRGIATAAIDVSDGLLGDLGHILQASGCGAEIAIDSVAACSIFTWTSHGLSAQMCREMTAAGGDDYELVFTAPPSARAAVAQAAASATTPAKRIGRITAERTLVLRDADGALVVNTFASFDHFAV